ncbi:peroxiredoxin family protein [Undibacterium parvum]|uniref:TlpA family protein disulfide reductase n=1 Tax=Undibacterium parvum TaxID=401471 RepID=A0A3Q9BS14_9BURK|nr:TlpA disulfide reductase family protein [Undibacterium parvum]AZP13193.1 TlpA family protein disulfide reductase [Undibacterium parvum]
MKKREFILAAMAASASLLGLPVLAQQTKEAQKEAQKFNLHGLDANGKKLELSDYLGKTVLVSFFTAGCSLCSRDLKLMREFYVGNAKRNFVLLAINIDQEKKDFDDYNKLIALAVPKEQRFPTVWRNAPEHKDNFGVITRQPTHFVINAKNQLVFKREGSFLPNDWDTLWESLDS